MKNVPSVMKTILFLILTLLFGSLARVLAQNKQTVDSLLSVLSTKLAGDRYSPLYELTFEYINIDNSKALKLIEKTEEAALLSGDSLWIVKSKRVKGYILYKLERLSDAIRYFEASLVIARRNGFEQESRKIFGSFALAYLFNGEFDKALVNFNAAVRIAEEDKDTVQLIQDLNNMGITYYQLHDARKALTYQFRVLEIEQRTRQAIEESWADINISLCYILLCEYSKAEFYLNKSLAQCVTGCSEKREMHNEFASGLLHFRLNENDRGLKSFLRSLSLARKRSDSRMTFDNLVAISELLVATNRTNQAEQYLKKAEKLIGPKAPFPIGQIQVYSQFCEIYARAGDFQRLSFYQHKYIHLKDSIFNYELTTRLMSAEADFKAREGKERIAAQNDIISLKEAVIGHQKKLNIMTAALSGVVFLFAVFLLIAFRRKKELNTQLEKRVYERTCELESSHNELLRTIGEKERSVDRPCPHRPSFDREH